MKRPLSVLHIHAGNLFGGIERVLTTLAQLDGVELEHRFALCFDSRLRTELEGCDVRLLGGVRMSRPWTTWRARRRLRDALEQRPDVALCHAAWAQAVFGHTVQRAGVPLVRWYHGARRRDDRLERLAARNVPVLGICNSAFTQQTVADAGATERTEIVHPPVPPVATSPADRARVRREHNIEDGAVVILCVSRLERGKGHPELLEALARLKRDADWCCWIAGGPQRPAERRYLATLRDQMRALDLDARVAFLGERDDVGGLYAAADLFCQANTAPDAFGVTFVEALSAGVPVVTSALGGALEIVDDETGVSVPPDDIDALTRALQALITDREARARLAVAGPNRARQLSDPASQIGRLAAALRTVAP